LTLGDNRRVDLSKTMIFMTSNLGGREIMDLMTGRMGFAPTGPASERPSLDEKVGRTATEAAKRNFSPEFMNRIDKVVVFHPLRSEQLDEIFEIELGMVQRRVLQTAKERFLFRVTQPAKEFLLREGTDLKYGARHLKRAIERYLTCPLACLLATEQVRFGDVISIDWDGGENGLRFFKEPAGALASVSSQLPDSMALAAVASSDGRKISAPFPKKVVSEKATADGTAGSALHRLTRPCGRADIHKSKTQVERVRVIARPHR